jgi:exodeoxyribonuclease V gamma subunit
VEVLEHPVKWFVRRRLQVSLPGETDDVDDRLPLELERLARWPVGDRLLAACLAGVDRERALAAEWRRGAVPPRTLGRTTLAEIEQEVLPIAAAARRYTVGDAATVDVTAELPSGTRLSGTVPGVHGDVVVRATYSRLAPKHRLRAWVQLLALVAAQPGRPWRAVTVGRAPGNRPLASVARLTAPDPAEAAAYLDELVRLRELATREPLPMPVAAACAYARTRYGGNSPEQALDAAAKDWNGGFERGDAYHVLCWGEEAPLPGLVGEPDGSDRRRWPQDTAPLGVLARTVWNPLLGHEESETT